MTEEVLLDAGSERANYLKGRSMNWFINFSTEGNTWINVDDISTISEDRENRCAKVLMKSGDVLLIDGVKQDKSGETNWQRFVRIQSGL